MNKYTELSDFEINLAVAHIVLGKNNYDWCSDKKEVYFAGIDGGEFLHHGYFDPCNNPSDAMPIIIENCIGILPYKKSQPLAFDLRKGLGSGILIENKNIYRAAMEVFLMMKDKESKND